MYVNKQALCRQIDTKGIAVSGSTELFNGNEPSSKKIFVGLLLFIGNIAKK